jgi:hypothetical protein
MIENLAEEVMDIKLSPNVRDIGFHKARTRWWGVERHIP